MQETVYFANSRGEKLSATLHYDAAGNAPAVILGHCFTCSRHTGILRQTAQELAASGFSALRFDFSGNGQSQGNFADASYSKYITELQSAVRFMTARGASWIGLAGHSMGAAIALLTAVSTREVHALCMLAGRVSVIKTTHFLSDRQRAELQRHGQVSFTSRGRSLTLKKHFFADAESFSIPDALQHLKIPLLVVHGENDTIIPADDARTAKRLKPEQTELMVVPGGDHMFSNPAHRQQVAAGVRRWFGAQYRLQTGSNATQPA